mgnify:CR=1 FL=1
MKNAEVLLKNGQDFTQLCIEPYGRVSANKVSYKIYIGNKHIDTITIKHTSDTNIMLVWLNMEYDPKILDDIEKKYLRGIINPFKDRVTAITKIREEFTGKNFISICVHNKKGKGYEMICLPRFEYGTMYKNMKDNKKYSPKELGL